MNKKLKLKVLNPVGDITHEVELDWSYDQMERFVSSHRIIIEGDKGLIQYNPSDRIWFPKKENKDG